MTQHTPTSRATLQASQAFKPAEAKMTEYAKSQKALHDNHERLKLERLAREAAEAKRGRE
jgi:hypothetical protein